MKKTTIFIALMHCYLGEYVYAANKLFRQC